MPALLGSRRESTHVCDHSMTVMAGDEVLDLGGRGIRELVSADKVVGDFVLLRVRRFPVVDGNRPVLALPVRLGHGCGCKGGF